MDLLESLQHIFAHEYKKLNEHLKIVHAFNYLLERGSDFSS